FRKTTAIETRLDSLAPVLLHQVFMIQKRRNTGADPASLAACWIGPCDLLRSPSDTPPAAVRLSRG
ncbi:MAG: hypothetical protein K6T85_19105, partial [Gorillibacterium sp.]|nr:hypothetical protein [Gorillibacterium sp.]